MTYNQQSLLDTKQNNAQRKTKATYWQKKLEDNCIDDKNKKKNERTMWSNPI